MTDVDNFAYRLGLPERIRSRVEAVGRVELSSDEAGRLARTKNFHIGLIVLTCNLSVWLMGKSVSAFLLGKPSTLNGLGLALPFIIYLLAAMFEGMGVGSSAADVAKHVLWMVGARLLSLFFIAALGIVMYEQGK